MAESENVYVKIGERGRLIERHANTPADHVNLRGTGWKLKGAKGAPTKKDETAEPLEELPTSAASVLAHAEQAETHHPGSQSRDSAAASRSAAKAKSAAGMAG